MNLLKKIWLVTGEPETSGGFCVDIGARPDKN